MEKELPPKCPTCHLATVSSTTPGDFDCIGCGRTWYEVECEGEKTLASRTRKVKLRSPIMEGDRLEDVIRPVDPWVNPPPPADVPEAKEACLPSERSAHVMDGIMRVIDGCEVLIQFGSEKDRKSAILLLFHIHREFGLKPRPSHLDLIDEMCRNYGSLPGKPPEDAEERRTYTCNKCVANLSCPYAWDPYNTGGDCLAEK